MIRSVLDTNLLVSYLLTHHPPIAPLIDHHLARDDFVLVTAPEQLAELDRVLGYPELQRYYTEKDRTRFVALVMALSEAVDLPETIPRVCRDPDEDRVIACAVVGEADVIVSGDQIVVGAYGEDGAGGSNRGAAYAYRWETVTEPELTVSPGGLGFGDRGADAGPSPSQMVTVTNDGDLHISSVSLAGANTAEFAIESDSGQATLTPGGTRTIQVSFDPSCKGAEAANLSIASDDGDEATVNVALSGNGVPGSSGWYLFLPLVSNNN